MRFPIVIAIGFLCFLLATATSTDGSLVVEPSLSEKPPAVKDDNGDPLPEGAVARLGTLQGRFSGSMGRAAMTPDGSLIANIQNQSPPYSIRVQDAKTGKEIKTFTANDPSPRFLTFSPDQHSLAQVGYRDLTVWDVQSGKTSLQVNPFTTVSSSTASWTLNGNRLAVFSELRNANGESTYLASVFDIERGKLQTSFPVIPNGNGVAHGALSPDGRLLATCGQYYSRGANDPLAREKATAVQVWDVESGEEILRIQSAQGVPGSLVFAPDGRTLAVNAAPSSMIQLFDAMTGVELRRVTGRRGVGSLMQFSPDGKTLAAMTPDGVSYRWEVQSGKRIGLHEGPKCQARSLAYTADGTLTATGFRGQVMLSWDVVVGKVTGDASGHCQSVTSLGFKTDGKTIYSVDHEGRLIEWDAHTMKRLCVHPPPPVDGPTERGEGYLHHVLSSNGKYRAGMGGSGRDYWRVWDRESGKLLMDFEATFGARSGLRLTFGGDGRYVLNDTLDRRTQTTTLDIWNLLDGRRVREFKDLRGELQWEAFSPNGDKLAAVNRNYGNAGNDQGLDLHIWDLSNGELKGTFRKSGLAGGQCAFCGNRLVAFLFGDNSLRVINADNGKEMYGFAINNPFSTAAPVPSPDGRLIAMAYSKGGGTAAIEVWDLTAGTLRTRFSGHAGRVNAMAFSPDGNTLATGADDTTILLWDLTAGNRDARPLELEEKELRALWESLAEREATKANPAIHRLARSPKAILAVIQKELKPVARPKVEAKQIAAWIADLESEDFNTRKTAEKELSALGTEAKAALEAALKNQPTADLKIRLSELIRKLELSGPPPEAIRPLRCVEILERIATAEAKAILKNFAEGKPGDHVAESAKAALARLNSPKPED